MSLLYRSGNSLRPPLRRCLFNSFTTEQSTLAFITFYTSCFSVRQLNTFTLVFFSDRKGSNSIDNWQEFQNPNSTRLRETYKSCSCTWRSSKTDGRLDRAGANPRTRPGNNYYTCCLFVYYCWNSVVFWSMFQRLFASGLIVIHVWVLATRLRLGSACLATRVQNNTWRLLIANETDYVGFG